MAIPEARTAIPEARTAIPEALDRMRAKARR